MFLKSAVVLVLLIDCSIGLSLFSRNKDAAGAPVVAQPSNPSDTVPNVNLNFGCKCTLKGSPTPSKPVDPAVPDPGTKPVPNPNGPALPQEPVVGQPDVPTPFKPVFPVPDMTKPGGLLKPLPFNPDASAQLPDTLPNLPNPNQPKPEVSVGTPNGEVAKPQPFVPFQPFEPFKPFPGASLPGGSLPGQQSIPNIEKLSTLLQSLTGLDCTCNGDVSPKQASWFPTGFPFGMGK